MASASLFLAALLFLAACATCSASDSDQRLVLDGSAESIRRLLELHRLRADQNVDVDPTTAAAAASGKGGAAGARRRSQQEQEGSGKKATTSRVPSKRPNFLVIMTDDQVRAPHARGAPHARFQPAAAISRHSEAALSLVGQDETPMAPRWT